MDGLPMILTVLISVTGFKWVRASELCVNYWRSTVEVCQHGCCGDGYDRGCCTITAIIVGAVIAGLVVIGIIICIVVCVVQQSKKKQGRVIQPRGLGPQPNVMVINAGQPPPYGQPTGHPPPYGTPSGQPPPYGTAFPGASGSAYPPNIPGAATYNDPAYPPTRR